MNEPDWKDFYDFDAQEAWVDAMESLAPIDDKPTKPKVKKPYEEPF